MNRRGAEGAEKEKRDKGTRGQGDKGKFSPIPNPQSLIPIPDGWIEIGTIVAPQGLGGEVRVLSSSDFPERFEVPGNRWLLHPERAEPKEVKLLRGRNIQGKNIYVVKLNGVDDCNAAEELRGCKLLVLESDRPELGEDEYHVMDLIGLSVFLQESGELLGTVVDLLTAGNDLLEVQLHQGDKETRGQGEAKIQNPKSKIVLIPFVKAIVPVVDLEAGRVEITPPAGLLEIND